MLGNSTSVMRSAFGVKGCRDITFRNNTISGDLSSLNYAMRVNREGNNIANSNIRFYEIISRQIKVEQWVQKVKIPAEMISQTQVLLIFFLLIWIVICIGMVALLFRKMKMN